MTYTIKISNKNTISGVANVNTLYLDTISPSLVTDLKSTYEAFIADMEVTDTSIYVPLYKRFQVAKVPASSVLVITTDNSSEAIYYRSLKLNNSFILIDPDPITSAYVDPVLIEKTITENGIYLASQDDADGYSLVDVNVPNSYSAEDDGKVVINGALVSQSTHKPITTNGTGIDTTTYSSVDVDVPNTYTSEDNGKVVNNETLVSQTAYPTTITQNNTYDTTNYNSITVNVSGGGSSSVPDVVFYDYDGSVVASYSVADFANLSAMPTNPSHEGLTAQGWNWSLSDAKSHVASYGKLNIGQMYITSDGKTRLYFTVTKDNLSTELHLDLGSDTELDIDWGDGSEHTRWTSNDGDSSKSHEYASAGRYVIAIEVITGEFSLSTAISNIYKVEIGNGVTGITEQAFNDCSTLSSITIPNSVTDIGGAAFYQCYSLTSITIPNSVTSIGGNTFYYCYSLTSITIPNGVDISYYAFYQCYSLTSITMPNSVTSISEATFGGCSALSSIIIPDSVTDIGQEAFSGCYALSSIIIPDSVTSIDGSAFYGCYALSSIIIPNSVTSIGNQTFYNCYSLSSITIPNSVTSIDESAFSECHALLSITFESSTPPELYGDLAIPYTCIIRVPQGSLEAYTTAANYPDPSQYIYEEY